MKGVNLPDPHSATQGRVAAVQLWDAKLYRVENCYCWVLVASQEFAWQHLFHAKISSQLKVGPSFLRRRGLRAKSD